MPGGSWSTDAPPILPGTYFNFIAALQAAVTSGVTGTAAIIGTSNWGPAGQVVTLLSQGELEQVYGRNATGTLPGAVLSALDGFDPGGAAAVLAIRAAGTGALAATAKLNDATTPAITLTAKYLGARPSTWTLKVQTNAITPANKDLILYESGVELERWENVASGYNDGFVAAINASNSPFVTATIAGAASRALVNITGVVAGTGSFGVGSGGVAGNDGAALTAGDIGTALDLLAEYEYQALALADISDDAILDVFAAWVEERNDAGQRFFGVIGGPAAEPLAGGAPSAAARSVEYDAPANHKGACAINLVNIGGFDVRNVEDGAIVPPRQIAPRLAGALATLGLTRSLTNMRWSGYQVVTPLSVVQQEASVKQGVLTMENDGNSRVRILQDVSTLLTTNTSTTDPRPAAHKKVRNVAIDHFIQTTLDDVVRDTYMGTLPNTPTGRRDLAASFLGFLQGLEEQSMLQSGESMVELDEAFVQGGNAVFLKGSYIYVGFVERVMTNFRVRA